MLSRLSNLLIAASVVILAGTAATEAVAHHGWGYYREDIEITLTITKLKLGNPHDRLIAVDESGQEWNLLLAPPARNRRFDFNEDTLSAGEVIDLVGRKHPDRHEIKVHCIFRGDTTVYTYRYDDGRSSLKRAGRDERC